MGQKRVKVKPSKFESMIGFVVGCAFVLIGLFIAIPTSGLFGLLWTFVAVCITVFNYKNAFSEKGIATHEIVFEEDEEESTEAKLKKLQSLYEQKLITQEEYEKKRQQILDEF